MFNKIKLCVFIGGVFVRARPLSLVHLISFVFNVSPLSVETSLRNLGYECAVNQYFLYGLWAADVASCMHIIYKALNRVSPKSRDEADLPRSMQKLIMHFMSLCNSNWTFMIIYILITHLLLLKNHQYKDRPDDYYMRFIRWNALVRASRLCAILMLQCCAFNNIVQLLCVSVIYIFCQTLGLLLILKHTKDSVLTSLISHIVSALIIYIICKDIMLIFYLLPIVYNVLLYKRIRQRLHDKISVPFIKWYEKSPAQIVEKGDA